MYCDDFKVRKKEIIMEPFLFLETKKVGCLVIHGLTDDEIEDKVFKDNIFKIEDEDKRNKIISIILNRIKFLDRYLLEKLISGSLRTEKLVVVYTIMKTDNLFFSFMCDVYKQKILNRDFTIKKMDFEKFFKDKKGQDSTKIEKDYISILYEAGLISSKKSDSNILVPIVNKEFTDHFRKMGDEAYIIAPMYEE